MESVNLCVCVSRFFFFLCYSVYNVVSMCDKSGDVPAHRAQVQQLNDIIN